MLDETGNVKLGDLGLVTTIRLNTAGATEHLVAPNDGAGTVYWQAPEAYESGSNYGRKADVWFEFSVYIKFVAYGECTLEIERSHG